MVAQVGGRDDRGGEDVPGGDGKPAPASAPAIELREVVLVTSATGYRSARSRASAATAPDSGCHDTVSMPSMSISTARMRRMPRPYPAAAQPARRFPHAKVQGWVISMSIYDVRTNPVSSAAGSTMVTFASRPAPPKRVILIVGTCLRRSTWPP